MFKAMQKLGFTMIELLIVIAVLGILAVAVLSAINPIEQINRGKDTGSRSDAEQLVSAIDRYYAGKGFYPWVATANATVTSTATTAIPSGFIPLNSATVVVGNPGQPLLTNLSAGGASELKSSFTTRIVSANYRTLSVYNNGISGSSTYTCFIPQSNSFREEAWKRCADGAGSANVLPADFPALACPAAACTNVTNAQGAAVATGCYICLP